MQSAEVLKLYSARVRVGLLAVLAGLAWSTFTTAQAAERITGFRDADGRVIFVNEQPPEPLMPAASARQSDEGGELSSASTAKGLAVWDSVIASAAQRHKVDPDLVRAVVRVESNFNPRAVSPKGARGLMQLIPATARRFGVSNIMDPHANVDGGVRYLKYLMTLFRGDLRLSLAAYNAGENAVGKHNGVPPYAETQDYLRKISRIYPFPSSQPAVTDAEEHVQIAKFLDSKGVTHFTNTNLP